ncbi:hypothetical protein ES689_00235 [Frigoribacterium sp. ACAM 257]|uniref:VOC family protein n=1 Tax=Frigoribacterium sp. ACAM 257 TaxID=2508998 RepID=UPI0011B9DEB5|nr:hypothetical protein [Frigoribacterium sp. ACAM 257]TWX39969.1 hypothetical protein ES689_00235 [Frigoribacterium sp. ACAM 257]
MTLFISCPVADVERATAFYAALGWELQAAMSGPESSCFAIAPDQNVMLTSRAMRQFDDLDGYHWSPFWMKPDTEAGATASA